MDIFDQAGRAHLLSKQVTGARYFFLHLAPNARGRFRLAFGGCEQCIPGYEIKRRGFDFCVLEYVARGHGEVVLDGTRFALQPGSAFAYSRKTRCEIKSSDTAPLRKYFLCLDGRSAGARLQRAGVPTGQSTLIPRHNTLQLLFEELIQGGKHGGADGGDVCQAYVELLLAKIKLALREEGIAANPSAHRFAQAKGLIDSHPERWQSLAEVAQAAHLQPETLCRLFKRYQGESPYRYLLRRKMILAASYLLENGGLVKDAAARVGFSDALHFSRVFKSIMQVPPSEIAASSLHQAETPAR